MSKVLVVSYSLGGSTRYLADEIAKELGADSGEILDPRPREGVLGYLRAGLESVARGLPSIIVDFAPTDYELVVLGTPVWAGTMASPMRSFLFSYAQKLPKVACFCTMGGRGARETLAEMKALLGAPDAPTMSVSDAELRKNHRSQFNDFIAMMRIQTLPAQVSVVK